MATRIDDNGVVAHWWLIVGVDERIFDPTAHQFDLRGGISVFRYIVEDRPFVDWRAETRWSL